METDKFIRLNTVFKVPTQVAQKAINLSQEIAQTHKTFFVLDGINFHPHITIYPPEYPESNIDQVLNIVKEVARNSKKIKFTFKTIDNFQGSIGVCFKLSPEIQSLHEKLVKKLNPLREGHLREKYQVGSVYRKTLSSEELANIDQYGYHGVMHLYNPHLTVIRLEDESFAETISNYLRWNITEFIVDKLAIYTSGVSGTVKKFIKEFNLK